MSRGREIVLDGVESGSDVERAKRWLAGSDLPEPKPSALARTVNGYNRAGATWAEANEWLKGRLPLLGTPKEAEKLSTQELLDLLFLFHRKERFCEGTLETRADEIAAIMEVLRPRRRPKRLSGYG